MSNSVVGEVYKQIVDRIIIAAQTDFEEGGYDPQTLQDLRKAWEENLTKLHVAQLPWDPQPVPPPATTPTLPSNAKTEAKTAAQAQQNGGNSAVQPKQEEYKYDPTVKQEKYENDTGNYPPLNGYNASGLNPLASQRAAFHLQQQFGDQANASIQAAGLNAAQGRPIALPGQQQQRPQHIQLPGQRPQPQYPHRNNSGPAQTDGASDYGMVWETIVANRQAHDGERAAVDGMLRRQLEQSMSLTDSGLMVPRRERVRPKKAKTSRCSKTGASFSQSAQSSSSKPPASIAQYDGPDSVRDEDEDAINSDLDDSEDELDGQQVGEEDGPLGETILCTYDKVQRVKNKWKCTLKDGILTTNGKEYLFHKATGEFEW